MLNEYTQTMILLGIGIVLLLLLVILIFILISIRKKQSLLLDSFDVVMTAIEALQHSVLKMDETIAGNFKDLVTRNVIVDSKQLSISDMLKDVAQSINAHHTKTMGVLGLYKKPNKPRRNPKHADRDNTKPPVK